MVPSMGVDDMLQLSKKQDRGGGTKSPSGCGVYMLG